MQPPRLQPEHSRRTTLLAKLCACALIALSPACEGGATKPQGDGQSSSVSPSVSAAAASAAASASGAPSSSQSSRPESPYAGTWQGSYKAVKGTVTVPPGVRYKSWEDDKEEEYMGEGRITLAVAADGVVSGSAKGALGEQSIAGQMDGDTLRAALQAIDPKGGMSGILTGALKGSKMEAELRVSDSHGNIVRRSEVTLSRAARR